MKLTAASSRLREAWGGGLFRSIAHGSFWSLLIKFGSAALSYLMVLLFSKAMNVSEFGEFSLGFSLASVLAVVASAGLHTAILRWIPEYRSAGREGVARYALTWSTWMTISASAAVSIAALAAILIDFGDRPIPGYLLAMIALIFPLAMSEFVGGALRATGSVIFSQLPKDILWRGAAIGMALYCAFSGTKFSSTYALLFLAISLTILVVPQVLVSLRQVHRSAEPMETDQLKRAWMSQLPPMWGIAVLYASTQYVDTVIVGRLISTEIAGAYFSASRTALLVSLMLVASVMVTAPMISSAYHSGDRSALQRILRFAALCSFVPTVVFAAMLVVAGRPLLLFFDPSFGIAYGALIILVVGQAVNALSGPMSYLLQLTGHGGTNFKIIAGCYAAGLIAQIILIPRIGMVGAALGSSGAIIAWNLISWRYATLKLKVDPTILSLFRRRGKRRTLMTPISLHAARPRLMLPDRRSWPLLKWFVGIALFYMLAFPKGGIKFQDIPITIGYVLTGPMAIIAVLVNFRQRPPKEKLICIGLCLAMGFWSLLCLRANGGGQGSYTIAYFVSLIFMPIFGMLFVSDKLIGKNIDFYEGVIVNAIRFLAVYGIFLFLFKYVTGSWIEIPYFTINVDDIGGLDDKYIDRGGVFKLISTYNNGNIFGVSMCILAPLYLFLEKRRILKAVFILALFLTLSRTVWIGMLIIFTFSSLSKRYTKERLFLFVLLLIAGAALVSFLVVYFKLDTGFVFDRNLGGRLSQFSYLQSAFFIPNERGINLPEIVYIGILYNYGYFGLLLFLLALLSPVIGLRSLGVKIFTRRKAAMCAQGLLTYATLAFSDGAYNLVPVLMIYWIVAALGLWYAFPNHRSTAQHG